MTIRDHLVTLDPIVDDNLLEYIEKRLRVSGYEIQVDDDLKLAFIIDRCIAELLDFTNRDVVPEKLFVSIAEYIVADYILDEVSPSDVVESEKEIGPVEQIKEGDTTLSFLKPSNSKSEIQAIYAGRKVIYKRQWLSYRRIKWQ